MRKMIALGVVLLTNASPLGAHAAEPLRVVLGVYRPPYVYEKNNEGLDYEIANAVFQKTGYKVRFLHSPNQRALQEIDEKKVDAVIGVSPNRPGEAAKERCYSKPLLYFDNVVISKKKSKLKIATMADLRKYEFVSFQKAEEYLGEEYRKMIEDMKRDTDVNNQRDQVKLFFNDKTQAIILDLRVFRHYQKELSKSMDTSDEVVVHRLFPLEANARVAAFVDKKVCQDFDRGFDEIKGDGSYQKILDRYSFSFVQPSSLVKDK